MAADMILIIILVILILFWFFKGRVLSLDALHYV